jgi:glycosyltransferase involved in cell wall biosynthesis
MRVAMLGPFGLRPKGTMAVRALPLVKALAARGHTVKLTLPPWSYPEDAGKAWEEGGVRIENVTISPRVRIPLQMLSSVWAFRPDVIHVFKPKAYSGAVQWLVWQLRRIGLTDARVVLDEDDWEGAGGWNDLERYPWSQKKVFAWQEQWGLTHADAVTVASRALETIAWSSGVGRERVFYLPNGVNPLPATTLTREVVREQLGLGDAPVVLLYTRFFEYDMARLGRVLANVLERVPNVSILLVGRGLFGEEQNFLELAQTLGWRDRVVNVGWVEPNTLRGYFAAADVALFPFDDTLVNRCKCSVKLIDLLANGVPVVAEAVGQVKEYIRHNESGVLIAPGDETAFSSSVIELLKDAEKRRRLGTCAAAEMAAGFGWERLAEIAERAYGVHRKG